MTATLQTPRAERTAAPAPGYVPQLTFFLGTVLLSGVVPLAMISATGGDAAAPGTIWLLPLAVVVWAGVRLAHLIGVGAPRLFQFVFWLYTYLFLGLAPLVQVRLERYPLTTPGVDNSHALSAAALVLCGLAAFELGGQARRVWPADRSSARPAVHISSARTALLVAAALAGSGYYIYKVGPASLLSSRDGISRVRDALWPDSSVASIVTAIGFAPLLVATHSLVHLRRASDSPTRRLGLVLLIVCCGSTLAFVANPVSSARYIFGTVGFSMLALWGAFATPPRARVWLSAILVTMIFVFPYADLFRRDAVAIERQGVVELFADKGDYDSFSQLQNSIEYVQRNGYANGAQALGVATFWVPRGLWPDKPSDTAVVIAEDRGYRFTNLSEPLWGEAYVNGGWLLTAVFFALLGWLLTRWDAALGRSLREQTWRAAVGAICAFYMFIILRGSLLQAVGYLTVIMGCLLFVRSRSTVTT